MTHVDSNVLLGTGFLKTRGKLKTFEKKTKLVKNVMILGSSIRTIIYDKCVCFWHVLLLVITMQCFASRSNAMCLFLLHTDAQLRCSHSDKQIFLQCLIQTNTALVFASGQKCTRLIALSARPRLFSG